MTTSTKPFDEQELEVRLRAGRRIVELHEALRIQAAELVRSNRELEQFAYVASHDLRNPSTVSSSTQLLARRYRGKLDADADKFIGFAVDGDQDADPDQRPPGLLARGHPQQGTRPTDSTAAFDLALANLRSAIEESGAVVTRGPLPTVMADNLQFGQLLQNLIGNALKYRGAEPPRVHVAAEPTGDGESDLLVRDNGIGIDPQYAERIFVIFQRLHTREEYSGTGIGLAICKKIVERHGGRIWVESQAGATEPRSSSRSPREITDHERCRSARPVEILLVDLSYCTAGQGRISCLADRFPRTGCGTLPCERSQEGKGNRQEKPY